MNITKIAATSALLFFATAFLVCAQAQKDEKGQPHEPQPQQHAQPAKAPAHQPQPRPQQEKGSALAPQQQHPVASKQQPAHTPTPTQPHSEPASNSRPARRSRRSHGSRSEAGPPRRAAGSRTPLSNRAAIRTGQPTIAAGQNAAATAVPTSPRPASDSISAARIPSTSAPCPSCIWDIRASLTAAFRFCWSIPGQAHGRKTGTLPMTYTSISTMVTTSTTAAIPASTSL